MGGPGSGRRRGGGKGKIGFSKRGGVLKKGMTFGGKRGSVITKKSFKKGNKLGKAGKKRYEAASFSGKAKTRSRLRGGK